GDFSYIKYSVDDKLTYFAGDHIIEAGIGADFMETIINFTFDLDPQFEAILSSNPQFRTVLSDLKDVKLYNRYRAYLQDNFKLTEQLTLQPSLRFDYYNILNKPYVAPRISASYAFGNLTTLRAAWGVYYQSAGYEKLRDQNILYDLSDRYTNEITAEKSIHYVLGIERWLSTEWSLKLEGYYKDFDNLYIPALLQGSRYFTEPVPGKDPRFVSGWTLPYAVQGDSLTQIPLNGSFGEAYGLEVMLAKKNIIRGSDLSGWVSYSLAFANRYENEKNFPFRFDQRHTVNIVLNYTINNWLELGIRWQYGSGFPLSQPRGIKPRIILEDQDLDGIPETPVIATRKNNSGGEETVIYDIDFGDKKLNSRKPEYHRLDVRLNALADWWDLDWVIYLDVINIYNHSNVIAYDYYVTDDLALGRESTTMLPILPTLGFSVRF
ncbi:MAG: TonB-dependent receptor, partial [Ignavibacteria bacterium]|nr:TonB-dependent receptor [Ignavibacteria bacterium]